MTYTDADLARAARRLCEIRGIDPDGWVWGPSPECHTTGVGMRRWEAILPELRAHLEWEQALMDVPYESTNEYVKEDKP